MNIPVITVLVMLFVGILTVLFGGITSAIVAYSLATQKQNRDALLSKLESLYNAAQSYVNHFNDRMLQFHPVAAGRPTASAVANQPDPGHQQEIDLLLRLYFPELRRHFLPLQQTVLDWLVFYTDVTARPTTAFTRPSRLIELANLQTRLRETRDGFVNAVFSKADEIRMGTLSYRVKAFFHDQFYS